MKLLYVVGTDNVNIETMYRFCFLTRIFQCFFLLTVAVSAQVSPPTVNTGKTNTGNTLQ